MFALFVAWGQDGEQTKRQLSAPQGIRHSWGGAKLHKWAYLQNEKHYTK